MKKMRFQLDTWDKGRAYVEEVAAHFGADTEERQQLLKVETDQFSASCNFDMREFSYLYIKLYDEKLEDYFNELRSKYEG